MPRFLIHPVQTHHPIGIKIYDVPGPGEFPGRGVNHLSLCNRSGGNCSNELSISELGPDQYGEGFFRYSEIGALRSYSQARIKLPIDNEQMVRIVGTGHHHIQLLDILDLCNFLLPLRPPEFASSQVNRTANHAVNGVGMLKAAFVI